MHYLLAVALLLTPALTQAITYPHLTPCNNNTISALYELHKGKDIPQDIVKQLEDNGLFVKLYTSLNELYDEKICAYVKVRDSQINEYFVLKNGTGPLTKLTFSVRQEEGVKLLVDPIDESAKDLKWLLYVAYFGNGVAADYHCSYEVSESTEPDASEIFVLKDYYGTPETQKAISGIKTMFEGWGFKYHEHDIKACLDDKIISKIP